MSSEWMKVMLEEIARKKQEEAQAQLEAELRRGQGDEGAGGTADLGGAPAEDAGVPGARPRGGGNA